MTLIVITSQQMEKKIEIIQQALPSVETPLVLPPIDRMPLSKVELKSLHQLLNDRIKEFQREDFATHTKGESAIYCGKDLKVIFETEWETGKNFTWRINVVDRKSDKPARELQKYDIMLLDWNTQDLNLRRDIRIGEINNGTIEFSNLRLYYKVIVRNKSKEFARLMREIS